MTTSVPMSQWPSEHRYTIPVAPGEDLVTITIDGKEVQVPRGELLIRVAQDHGTYIPRFCWHERMKPVGMCRMCLVEVEGMRGLQISCATPVTEGMVVHTESEGVKQAQDGVLEFLLINHPLDCPVCDRGGECPLQDQTLAFGPGESRFVEEKRHFEKPVAISDLVLLDRERCIQCGRCTRFASEVAGEPTIDFGGRGGSTQVITFPDEPFDSYFSGNTVQICPVGALTAKSYRFKARPWDLESVETSCQTCAVGCRGALESTSNRLVRLLGVDSEPVNQGWLCDKGRYGFEWVHDESRLPSPMVRARGDLVEASWPEALDAAASVLRGTVERHGAEAIAVLGGARGTNEDAYAWARLAKGVVGTDHVDAQLDDGLPADLVLGMPRATIADLDRARAIVLLGPELEEELPVLHLRVRRAAVDLGVPLVDVAARDHSLTPHATAVLRHAPGTPSEVVENLIGVLRAGGPGAARRAGSSGSDALEALAAALGESSSGDAGPVVVVLGRPSLAESAEATVHAASLLLELPDVRFLSALRAPNVHGALDLGLAPGFLPGRVTLDAGRAHVGAVWSGTPKAAGMDAREILAAAAQGSIRTLVVLDCDPLTEFPDRALARRSLEQVERVIVLGPVDSDVVRRADVVLPVTAWGEQSGTTSNLEGRVMSMERVVTPEGRSMEAWRIAGELAERLGTDFGFEQVDDVTDEIARVAPAFAGVDADRVHRARDGVVLPAIDHPEPVSPDRPGAGVSWEPIRPRATAGSSAPDVAPPVALYQFAGPVDAPVAVSVDAYSLRLVTSPTLYGPDRITAASLVLSGLASPDVVLRVSPRERDRVGVDDGALVRVSSPTTTLELPLVGDDSIPLGVAYLAFNRTGPGAGDLIDAEASVTDLRLES